MLAPISWLKDYADINVSPEVLAKKLVAIGFEVEEIIYQEKSASKVVVGKIVEVEKHPNADRLRVTQIDIGNGKIQVVTNVPVVGGETIAVALDGAVLADGHQIVKGQLRGVTSEGLLCGLDEIGATVFYPLLLAERVWRIGGVYPFVNYGICLGGCRVVNGCGMDVLQNTGSGKKAQGDQAALACNGCAADRSHADRCGTA